MNVVTYVVVLFVQNAIDLIVLSFVSLPVKTNCPTWCNKPQHIARHGAVETKVCQKRRPIQPKHGPFAIIFFSHVSICHLKTALHFPLPSRTIATTWLNCLSSWLIHWHNPPQQHCHGGPRYLPLPIDESVLEVVGTFVKPCHAVRWQANHKLCFHNAQGHLVYYLIQPQ